MVRSPTNDRSLSVRGALLWFSGSYGVALVGYLLINAVAGRFLGRASFGYFILAATTATIVGQLGLVGAHRSGLREGAKLRDGLDRPGDAASTALLGELMAGVRAVSRVTLPAVALTCGLVAWFLARRQPDAAGLALVLVVMVWLAGQQMLWSHYLRGFGYVRLASLMDGRSGGALVACLQATLLLVVWQRFPSLGLLGAFAALAAGYLVPVLLGWWVLRDVRRLAGPTGSIWSALGRTVRRDWRFASNQLAAYLNSTVELWLASAILLTVDVSLFGAASRLAMVLLIPLTGLQIVFAPIVARQLARGEVTELEAVLRTGATLATLVSAVLWLPMLLVPAPLLEVLFGAEFGGAATLLILLTIGNMPNVVSGLSGTVLTMSHHEGAMARLQWVTVLVRLVGGIIAVWLGGLPGLGVSAMVSSFVLYGISWRLARTRAGVVTHATARPHIGLLRKVRV